MAETKGDTGANAKAGAGAPPWLKTTLNEIWGLFVDDGLFAIAIVLWLLLIGTAARLHWLPLNWLALLLFGGLAVLLVESASRYARRR